ncbi:hypothetical protein B0T26DRAFT_660322 [Lasiosphaeria miniovina]|uniref:Uncharacterized protein n=1 Tax=Lasiosphaeria miniovina TaxID=1954250 RepID=A0AA39ZQE4_9PEZI|nr:uncharacterized protein B0T26DRAFT_660322 [Lasiosphaeria miniovina]KAK0701762.1 hypothetical protein B0T26DRAFT_660322 [Lasiosphaeria miniovina]
MTGRRVPPHLAEHEDDEDAVQRGYVKGTDFSLPYSSQWSRVHDSEVREGLLRHVNCGYLSTHGVPPTLLALKQHAQSLCVLIHALNPTLRSAEIMTGDPTERPRRNQNPELAPVEDLMAIKYERNDAFDFLVDLTVPYHNDDPNHNKPLNGLVNEVRSRHEAYGTSYHCALAETTARRPGEAQKPYANLHSLIMHANACLERLDHELSSTGGLLSLLPANNSTEHDSKELKKARSSILGSYLHWAQLLVGRMHDLERAYGNALDALAGEAAIPHQYLGALGPDGRSGREIAYPQDRWVLVNAGDDVFDHVHSILDRQEALVQAKEEVWRRNGASGDHAWSLGRDGKGRDYARGLVPVNIMTRYYRLAGQGRNTLFVLPAWGHHPGTAHTRETEDQPTIVSSAQPRFPARATELEKRYDSRIAEAQKAEAENASLRSRAHRARAQIETLTEQNRQLALTRDSLMLATGRDAAQLANDAHALRQRAQRAEDALRDAQTAHDIAATDRDRLHRQVEQLVEEAATLRARLREARPDAPEVAV